MRKFIILYAFFMLCFSGCKHSVDSFTVWIDFSTYSEFETAFSTTLNDGMYIRSDFTSEAWKTISASLTNEGKHIWSKSQIKDWFIGRGFGDSEATQETAWLTSTEHGFIASRSGNTVYYILK